MSGRELKRSGSEWVPRAAALATACVGMANILSAVAPQDSWEGWRSKLMLGLVGVRVVNVSYAIALAVGAAFLVLAPYLLKRRRRALTVTIVLMVGLGFVSLFKGLDLEGVVLHWAVAGSLMACRRQFTVAGEPITLRSAVWRVPLIGAFGVGLISFVDWLSSGRPQLSTVAGESSALLRLRTGQLHFEVHTAHLFGHPVRFEWIPLGVHLLEVGTLFGIAYAIFRPLARPTAFPTPTVRKLAVEVVRKHGQDTLSFFKLRPDKHYFFSEDRTAFVGYRIEAGAMLLSGDPVGPPEAFPELLLGVRSFARSRGLRLAALGASEALVPIYDGLGLHCLYLGDEAVVEVGQFSLEGRPIRKVRQSVSRLRKAGYGCELRTLEEIPPSDMPALEHVLQIGRIGKSERGFAMGMDSIHGEREQDTLFVIARDESRQIRGVLHLVPCYGRAAVSLSMMRRDPATPNGLMEFLVVNAIEMLRERGVEELSLNFAALTKYMRDPQTPFERILGRVSKVMNPYFQIESLYRFNVKFFPRWDPRYLVYEGRFGIPRAALASMWAEGQVPKPSLHHLKPASGQPTLHAANR